MNDLSKRPTNKTWVRMGLNIIMYGDDVDPESNIPTWGVSYNPNTNIGMIDAFAGDGDGEETALIDSRSRFNKYYVLNGDWRKDYEKLIDQGFEACKKFFDSHKKYKSSWSS